MKYHDNNILMPALMDTMHESIKVVAELIKETYHQACTEVLFQVGVKGKQLGNRETMQIFYELYCFLTFLITKRSQNFIGKRGLIKFKPDYEKIKSFNQSLVEHLIIFLEGKKFTQLNEIVLISIEPEIKFGEGEQLNPTKRLNEYYGLSKDGHSKEIYAFAKYIAKALDADHYPSLELIGTKYVMEIVKISDMILKGTFK